MTRAVRWGSSCVVAALALTALDGLALAFLLRGGHPALVTGGSIHLTVSLAVGLLGARAVATPHRDRALLAALLGGLALAAVPVGALGSLAFVLVKLFPRPAPAHWCLVRPIVPDGARLLAASYMLPSATDLREVLQRRTDESAERRLRAALSTRALAGREAISLLREALSDPNEEVRLFAFSRIDHFRGQLEAQARQMEATLAEARPGGIARIHYELARARCELAYLGLVDGAVRDHTLANAREHAVRASELAPELASSEWMLGRIALTLSEAPRAIEHFERAMNLGMSRRRVLPYLAEAAYQARRFPQLRASLREYAQVKADPVLLPVVEVWQ